VDKEARRVLAIWVWFASAAVVLAAAVGAWETFDYWETIPIFSCVSGAGVLGGAAGYVHTRSRLAAFWTGLAMASSTLFVTFVITGWVCLCVRGSASQRAR